MSLAEELTKLANPNPPSLDPEDDTFEETKARLVEKDDIISHEDESSLGNKRMPSLDGMGSRYKGKKVSRNNVMHDDQFSSDEKEENISGMSNSIESDDDESVSASDGDNSLPKDGESDEEIDSDEVFGEETLEIFKHQNRTEADSHSKGVATRSQISLWENTLELRIKCQKMLTISNQLPQQDTMDIFKEQQLESSVVETSKGVNSLLCKLLNFQTSLLKQNPQLSSIEAKSKCAATKRKSEQSLEDIDSAIGDTFVNMQQHRNKILKLWYDKTRLTSAAISNTSSKSFSSFEKSTVAQIQHILQDKERLIKRTQLLRSNYRILGMSETTRDKSEEIFEHSHHLKEFNNEIFDDDDFYHQLLRELIEQKASMSGNASDPLELTRQWLKIQRLRTKVNKTVDTKASKGRKIRYEIHQKLVSFMAPNDQSTFTHEARNQLFRSLFGKVIEEDPEN